jgi:hypothetical protein
MRSQHISGDLSSSDQELGDKSGYLFERRDDHLPQHGLSSPLSHILAPVGGNWIEVVEVVDGGDCMNLSRVYKVCTAPRHWLQWEETGSRNVRGRRISSKRMLIDPWRTGQVEMSWKMRKT